MARKIRYNRQSLKDFSVRAKVRGRWQAVPLNKTGRSYAVPKAATAYKILLKTRARSITLTQTKFPRQKRKHGIAIGKARLERALQKRQPKKPRGKDVELLLDYLKRTLGAEFGLSAGMLPQSLYASKMRFFTKTAELTKRWKFVRIWFAIVSDGMSDGSELEDGQKAYVIDALSVGLPGKGETLKKKLVDRYEEFVNSTLYSTDNPQGEQGWVNRHNDRPGRKKWAASALFLGVEGDFRRTATAKVKAKRIRAGVKVSKAHKNPRPRHRNS